RNGARDRLPDPPRGVGRELVTAAVLELVHRLHQADVALLNQVEELETAVGVFLCDGDHEAEVGLDQLALGALGVHVALDHLALGALDVRDRRARIGFYPLKVGLAVLLLPLVLLAQFFALGGLVLGLERLDLPLQRAHALDRLVHTVQQPLLLRVGVLELAHDARDVHLLAAHQPAGLALVARLRLGVLAVRRLQALFERGVLLLVLDDDVDAPDGRAHARLQNLFGQFLLIEGHDLLDVAHATAQVLAEAYDFADDDRRTRDRLHHAVLPALNALGDFDLALARQQRHCTHLPQVHADGVVGLFELARRKVELNVLRLFARLWLELVPLRPLAGEYVDALRVDGRQQVVQVIRRRDVARQQIIHLAEGQVALLLAGVNQLLNVVFKFVDFFSHGQCALLLANFVFVPRANSGRTQAKSALRANMLFASIIAQILLSAGRISGAFPGLFLVRWGWNAVYAAVASPIAFEAVQGIQGTRPQRTPE